MVKTEFFLSFVNNKWSPLKLRERVSTNSNSQIDFYNESYNTQKLQFIKSSLYFFFSYLFLSLAGNIIVYMPNQGTNREKYFNHITYQRKRCRLWREINTLPSISSLTDRDFSIFRQKKVRVRSVGNGLQIGFSCADKINKNINKRSKIFPYR